MENWYTETGRREDLEAAFETLNPYHGFIGPQIMPFQSVDLQTGTYYYQTLQADVAAQTNRVNTAAPTRVTIGNNSSTWSATERIKGHFLPIANMPAFGSVAAADAFGAEASIRSVARSVEAAIVAQVLNNGSATVDDIENSFIQTAQTGLQAIKRYPGRKALVFSETVFHRVMRYTEITDRFGLSSAQVNGVTAEQIIAREPEALRMLLRAIIGVDEVLVGDDDQWYDGDAAYQDRAALVVLPEVSDRSYMRQAEFGRVFQYLPQGQEYPYFVESIADRDVKGNKYDCTEYDSLEVMNAGALYILDGIDESNTVTTTTTTTA
jgi:hypothetical protein